MSSELDTIIGLANGPIGAAATGLLEGIFEAIAEAARAPGLDEKQAIERMYANARRAVERAERGEARLDAAERAADEKMERLIAEFMSKHMPTPAPSAATSPSVAERVTNTVSEPDAGEETE